MAKLTLTDVLSGFVSIDALNANNTAIEIALENTLSRDGTTPNTMSANLDMNSNKVINLAIPTNNTDAVRLVDLSDSDATGAASATLRAELALASESTGSDLVGFISSGTGAVAQTTQDKLRNGVVHQSDFATFSDLQLATNPVSFYLSDTPPPKLQYLADRVFIGDSVNYNGGFHNTEALHSWVATLPQPNLAWIERDAQLSVVSSKGFPAITGASRTSDAPLTHGASIGVIGVGYTNTPAKTTWAGYFDAKREELAGNAFALELEVADLGTDGATLHSYGTGYGDTSKITAAIWLAAGADTDHVNPISYDCSVGIHIGSNKKKFKKGIIFNSNSLVYTGAVSTAIEMPIGARIQWAETTGQLGAEIHSTVTDTANRLQVFLTNNQFWLKRADELFLNIIAPAAGTVANYPQISAAITGNPVVFQATGTDTNIDLHIAPKGTGVVKFGAWTTNTDQAINGYITIKDYVGNIRKLATIA